MTIEQIWMADQSCRALRMLWTMGRIKGFSSVYLTLALGLSFLSAIADRFGLWRVLGKPNAACGDFSHFIIYTAKLNWFMPSATTPSLAWGAT